MEGGARWAGSSHRHRNARTRSRCRRSTRGITRHYTSNYIAIGQACIGIGGLIHTYIITIFLPLIARCGAAIDRYSGKGYAGAGGDGVAGVGRDGDGGRARAGVDSESHVLHGGDAGTVGGDGVADGHVFVGGDIARAVSGAGDGAGGRADDAPSPASGRARERFICTLTDGRVVGGVVRRVGVAVHGYCKNTGGSAASVCSGYSYRCIASVKYRTTAGS